MRPAYHELRRRGGGNTPRSPVTCGRKHCAGCGRWRHGCDFAPFRGGLRARCVVCTRAYNRAWVANATPEQRDRMREYARIWEDAQRRKAGAHVNGRRRPTAVDRAERILLDARPLRTEVARLNGKRALLSRRSGVPERTIYRLLNESRYVRLDVADKLAVALGIPLAILYPGDR